MGRIRRHRRGGRSGEASCYSLVAEVGTVADAAWNYPAPMGAAEQITDRLAFWTGVKVFND